MAAATAAASSATPLPVGIFESGDSGLYSFTVTPQYALQYYGWNEDFQTADAQAAWDEGTETFAELQTCGNPCNAATSFPISKVINGSYDAYLKNFANEVAAFSHPVLLTFDHEMNGSWYPWGDTEITPTQWIEAWQHVTSLISSIAPNAVWVWAPNIEQGAAPVASYWPGNGYPNPHVSVVGVDGYFQNPGSTWANTFSQSVTDIMKVSGGKYPFIVAETGVPSTDSNNVSQIDNLVAGARSAGAAALMYFDFSSQWAFTAAEQSAFVKDVESATQPNPVQPTPSQPTPAQPAPVQPAPAQPTPSQPAPAQPTPSQPTPSQPAPAQPAPSQPSPAQPTPAQPAPAQPAPVQPRPAAPLPTGWQPKPRHTSADRGQPRRGHPRHSGIVESILLSLLPIALL